jgi:S-methyl-5-thioribulose 1-phosphate isomerase
MQNGSGPAGSPHFAWANFALTILHSEEDRLRVTYELAAEAEEDAAAKARDIALEQTVELPEGSFPAVIEERIVGRVESLTQIEEQSWRAVISFDPVTVGDDLLQLLNVLFGNISLKSGIRLAEVGWPPALLSNFEGPGLGVAGLRRNCGVSERRPLLCAALKPMGLSAAKLAELAYEFARGGVDIIKDDHGLANQATAPFEERVAACQAAVQRANRETGGSCCYFPNATAGWDWIGHRAVFAAEAGCRGVLVSPFLAGLDTLGCLAEACNVAVLAHPSFSGSFFSPGHGIAPQVLLGDILRLAGSDGVIYPNAGGRFPFSETTCAAINRNLLRPLGDLRPSMPSPGGGIDVARVPHWIERYGTEMMLLIGGSFYLQRNLRQAARELQETIRRYCDGT